MTSRSKKPTGGPAFPRAGNEWSDMEWVPVPGQAGMTLRDYFAALAMQGMMSCPQWNQLVAHNDIAEEAYMMADAMLEVRDVR